ncbi:anti-sigma factor antagonist [Streptomyces sp. NPDC059945]
MRIVVFNRSSSRATVFLEGEIDGDTAFEMQDVLAACLDGTTTSVDVDLGAVSLRDANVFLDVAKRSAGSAGGGRLHRPSGAVLRLLTIVGTGVLLAVDVTGPLRAPDSKSPASDAA